MTDYKIKTTFTAKDQMSKTIGAVEGRLNRFVARTSRGLNKLNKYSSAAAGVLTKGLKYGAAIATGAAVGLYAAVNKVTGGMDSLAKKTRAMDFPIEAFQEFSFAAQQSGISADMFEGSMGKFMKSVSEMKSGQGMLYTSLKKTNPQLLKQMKRTTDTAEAFDLYLGAMRGAPNEFKRTALATAAFGRSGLMMNLLAKNSEEQLKALREEMRANGIVTADQAAAAEKYNDQINSLNLSVKGLLVGAIGPLLPIMTEWGGKLRDLVINNRELITVKVKEYITWIIDNLPEIFKWLKRIGTGIVVFYTFAAAVKAASVVMGIFNTILMIKTTKAAAAATAAIKATGAAATGAAASQAAAATSITAAGAAAKVATSPVTKLSGALGALTVGVGIGLAIHEYIIEPLMKANHQAKRLRKELDHTMSGNLSNRTIDQLEKAQKVAKKAQKEEAAARQDLFIGAAGRGFAPMSMISGKETKEDENVRRLEQAIYVKKLDAPKVSERDATFRPYTMETSTTRKDIQVEQVEVVIRDKSGKAEIKRKNKNSNLKLAHSGAF